MADVDPYPPAPKHFPGIQSPNYIWPDGSEFCFDLPPRYVLDEWTSFEMGGIYQVPVLPMPSFAGGYMGWTNWVDKMQKDYRFTAMSDSNARANLFPEVQDPWMFTEYVYEGSGKINDQDTAATVTTGIVSPPLLNPIGIDRTVTVADGVVTVSAITPRFLNSQPSTSIPFEHEVVYDLENQWKSEAGEGKTYWTSELAAMAWTEFLPNGDTNRNFTKLAIQRRYIKYAAPKNNSGLKLYREPVWAESSRWGQSQNVPGRVINMTGPQEYLDPKGLFTGKIVPTVTIQWGIPINDNCTTADPQKAIRYDSYGSTAGGNIILFPRTLTGSNGHPEAIFTYSDAPLTATNGDKVLLPRTNYNALQWNPPSYVNNDLVHRGCQFWVGHEGSCKCTYYTQFQSNFQPIFNQTITFTDPAMAIPVIETGPFSTNQYELKVFAAPTDGSSPSAEATTLGGNVASILVTPQITNGQITSVSLTRTDGSPIFPANGDFISNPIPGNSINVQIIVRQKNTPYPSKTLCGSYNKVDGTQASGQGDAVAGYKAAGGKCAYYSPTGAAVVASYTMEASNGAELANMQHGLPPGYKANGVDSGTGQSLMAVGDSAGGMGFGVVSSLASAYAADIITPDAYTSGNNTEQYERTTITYEPEIVTLNGKQTYYNTKNGIPPTYDAPNFLRIKPDTSYFPIDFEKDAAYSGVDSVFFGMVNQLNYRIMRNVMHCFKADKCTTIINTPGGNVGWTRGRYSNIDFSGSPLRVAGYPGIDGTDRYCHSGDSRCPYNHLDRRANEYNENYKILLTEVLAGFRASGMGSFSDQHLQEAFVDSNGHLFHLDPADQTNPTAWANAICVAIGPVTGTLPVIGHWQPVVTDTDGVQWRIYFYYDTPSFIEGHTLSRVWAHLIQFTDDNQPCYLTSTDTATTTKLGVLFGAHVTTAPWIVELEDNYVEPTGNTLWATNGSPFTGGRNPEYKDHSKRGTMIMSRRGGYSDDSYRTGATDSNQFGGPSSNRAPVVGISQVSYWTQAKGEWILDGRTLGVGKPYVGALDRMSNKPTVMFDNCYPVDGTPGLIIEPATDDPNASSAGTGGSRSGSWASVGATYSNDTNASITYIQSIWANNLPIDPDTGDTIDIVPPSTSDYLPRERFWYRCDQCGIDFPEEEVTYLTGLKHADNSPFYPIPTGWTSPTPAAGSPPTTGTGACGCPRHDGGVLVNQGTYDRFMNCYARGSVDVWGPPGSTVMHNGFFWKNPTLINRFHKDQALLKLGQYVQNPMGGGYSLTSLEPNMEKLGRLPDTTAHGYQPGLSRQILYPVAGNGANVAFIRTAVTSDYSLLAGDVAIVQKPGQPSPTTLTPSAESSTTLSIGDVVTFWRGEGDGLYVVGLPVAVMPTLPQSVLGEPLVKTDISSHPRPDRSTFTAGVSGDQQYNQNLRQWLIDVVFGSLQHWSSSIYVMANAMAMSLTSRGINPAYASPLDPVTGKTLDLDERILGPYATKEAGSLKMLDLPTIKQLRNRVIPYLAYNLTIPTYFANGDFTDEEQADNLLRYSTTRKEQPTNTFGTINPQVMAATSTGKDYYTEWDVGDIEGTKARAYYPVGTTWWRMNQLVGQIKRSGGTNRLHLDNAAKNGDGTYQYDEYTGDTITSVVAYFMHGRIPMDKEVVRALLIYSPQDPPSMSAIGCQGQYSGYSGYPNSNGQAGFNHEEYIGTPFCFWQHYHGFTTNHESDIGDFGNTGNALWGAFSGPLSKRHAEKHAPNTLIWDDYSLPSPMTDPVTDPYTGAGVSSEIEDRTTTYNSFMQEIEGYLPWLGGRPEILYLPQVSLMGQSFDDSRLGFPPDYNLSAFHYPYQEFLMRSTNDAFVWGQPIIFVSNEHQTWKDMSFAKYDTIKQRYQVDFKAAVNTAAAVQTETYYGELFRSLYFGREQQSIPGWLSYDGYDSSGRIIKDIPTEVKVVDTPPFLVQTTSSLAVTADPSGGNGAHQAGTVSKVLNITDTFTKLYNDRVNRYFKCQLGHAFTELYTLESVKTDTNLGQNPAFHQGVNDPLYWWNYRYFHSGWGMWLNDPWHNPPLTSKGEPQAFDDGGDPLVQAVTDQQARILDVSSWDGDQKLSTDATYLQYHPFSLLGSTSATFDATVSNAIKPAPVSDPTKYWRAISDRVTVNSFTVSTMQLPYETNRRNWRFMAPGIDSTNALCPNISCLVHDNHWTVGQYLANAQGTWGLNTIPSTHSDTCAMCGTKLTGVVYTAGDGIVTVTYGPQAVDDALIGAVEVSSDSSVWNASAKHGFIVEYWNTVIQQWGTLLSVDHDSTTNLYSWQQWNGTAWVVTTGATVPTAFLGADGVGDIPKAGSANIGKHFVVVGGQKLRYRVPQPAPISVSEPTSGYSSCVPNLTTKTVRVTTLGDTPSNYAGKTIYLFDGTNEFPSTITQVTPDPANTPPSFYDIEIAGTLTTTQTQYSLRWTSFISRCSKFRVWGYSYTAGEVTITPPGFVQPLYLTTGVNAYQLNNWPSQISTVSMTAGENVQINSIESTTTDPASFAWTVQKDTFNGVDYLKIVQGMWYYDFTLNRILVPTTYIDPVTRVSQSIWGLNQALYADLVNPFQIKTLPTGASIQYVVACGSSLTVPITPFGPGPSYQLDRECVCFIVGENDGGLSPTDAIGPSDPLPVMGKSVKLTNRKGQNIDLKWQVYNHNTICWPDNSLQYLTGNELGAGASGDSAVMDLFTGNHGSNVSDLGPNAVITSNVTGEVTLYGPPNTIISGNVWVYAKDYTTRTYNLPDGTSVVTRERTGGLRGGAFVFRLEVAGTPSNRRTGLTATIPTVLVYLRERDLAAPLN